MKQLREVILENTVDGTRVACELRLYVDFIYNRPIFIVHNQMAEDFCVDDTRRYGVVFKMFNDALEFLELAKATWYGSSEVDLGLVHGCVKYHEIYEEEGDTYALNLSEDLYIEIENGHKSIFLAKSDDPTEIRFTDKIEEALRITHHARAQRVVVYLACAASEATPEEIFSTDVFNGSKKLTVYTLRKTGKHTHTYTFQRNITV